MTHLDKSWDQLSPDSKELPLRKILGVTTSIGQAMEQNGLCKTGEFEKLLVQARLPVNFHYLPNYGAWCDRKLIDVMSYIRRRIPSEQNTKID